jgi:hypothetical protein
LRVLLESDNTEARLNLLGKLAVRFGYLRSLTNRLRIQDTFKSHPAVVQRIYAQLGCTFTPELGERSLMVAPGGIIPTHLVGERSK